MATDCCPETDELIGYADGTLAPPVAAKVDRHLGQCEKCERRLEQIEASLGGILTDLRRLRGGNGSQFPSTKPTLTNPPPSGSTPLLETPPVTCDGNDRQASRMGPVHLPGRFGRYEILEQIGRGGMGAVYKARQPGVNRLVALKVLLSGQFASDEQRRRFLAEAEAAGALSHAHIVPIHEAGQHDGQLYFSMGFVDGPTLKSLIADAPLPPYRAAELMRTVAEAVHHAHAKGVIHRDLKPSNILIDRSGQPHVADFGLARRTDYDSSLTDTGQILGTPGFMPPEQALARLDQVNVTSDVYSLGATLYCVSTGRPPFQAATPIETLSRVVNDQPVAPRKLNSAIPVDLETICLKCLRKEAQQRYQSSKELADDLGRFLRNEPIDARPVRLRERLWRFYRRNQLFANLTAGVGLLAASIVMVITLAWLREQQHRQEKVELITQKDGLITEKQELAIRQRTVQQYASGLETENAALARNEMAEKLNSQRLATEKERLANEQARLAESERKEREKSERFAADTQIQRAAERLAAGDVWAAQHALNSVPFEWRNWEHRFLSRRVHGTPLTLPIEGGTSCLAFHSDGRRIAVGGYRGISICDVETGAIVSTLPSPLPLVGQSIVSIAYSPDGRLLASTSSDESVFVWNSQTGELKWSAAGPPESRNHGSVGPDCKFGFAVNGTRLVRGSNSGVVRAWDSSTGAEMPTIAESIVGRVANSIRCLAANPDGSRIATCALNGAIRIWDARTGNPLPSQPFVDVNRINPKTANNISWSPDGTRILGAGTSVATSDVAVYDVASGKLEMTLTGHSNDITFMAWCPDGTRIASASKDSTIRLWDARSGAQLLQLPHGNGTAIAFSPDGRRIAAVSRDNVLRVWDLSLATEDGSILLTRPRISPGFSIDGSTVLAWNSDGSRLAAATGSKTLTQWDARTWQAVGLRQLPPSGLKSDLTFGKNGLVFTSVIGSRVQPSSKVQVLHFEPRDESITLNAGSVIDLAISREGLQVATASNNKVTLWDSRTATPVGHIENVMIGGGRSLVFDPSAGYLAVALLDDVGSILLVDPETAKTIRRIPTSATRTFESIIAISPDGRLMATSKGIWQTETGTKISALAASGLKGSFSRDGSRLAIVNGTGVNLFDTVTGRPVLTLEGAEAECLTFDPDGDRLATCSLNGEVRVWDARIATQTLILPTQKNSLSPDGSWVACLDPGGPVHVVNCRTGRIVHTLSYTQTGAYQSVVQLLFNEDASRLVLKWPTGAVVWELPSGRFVGNDAPANTVHLTQSAGGYRLNGTCLSREPDASSHYRPWAENADRLRETGQDWHLENAATAEDARDWFAAAFHLQQAIQRDPQNVNLQRRYSTVQQHLPRAAAADIQPSAGN